MYLYPFLYHNIYIYICADNTSLIVYNIRDTGLTKLL